MCCRCTYYEGLKDNIAYLRSSNKDYNISTTLLQIRRTFLSDHFMYLGDELSPLISYVSIG